MGRFYYHGFAHRTRRFVSSRDCDGNKNRHGARESAPQGGGATSIRAAVQAEEIEPTNDEKIVNGRGDRAADEAEKKAQPQIRVEVANKIGHGTGWRAERANKPEQRHKRHAQRKAKR